MTKRFATVLIVMSIVGTMSRLNGQATPTTTAEKSRAERGYVSAMKSDLRTLATAEEAYFVDHNGGYFSGAVTASNPLVGFSPSANVTITVAGIDGGRQWIATATHALTPTKCTYQLPNPIVCDPPPPVDTLMFATPRETGSSPTASTDRAGPRVTIIGDAKPVAIRPARSRSWQFAVRSGRTLCVVSGRVVALSGGDKQVVVLIMTESDYEDWMHNRPARTYFESGRRTEIPFDVRIEGEGRYRLVVSNPSPTAASKVAQLQHTEVACSE